ncbi:MAG: hypothetical protein V4671_02985 [Armatimonadota bacterium]
MSATSEATCFYHADRPSVDTCTECRQPICSECQTTVAEKTVCRQCVSAIRERVAAEMMGPGAMATLAAPVQPMEASSPLIAESGVYQPYIPPVPAHTKAMGFKHVFGGFGLGFMAGLFGLVAWVAFVSFAKFNVSLFAIALGWLIGIATTKGAGGRGGNVVAIMSALLAFFFCGIGFVLFLGEAQAWNWIFGLLCFFFGIQQAYKTPMAVENHW